MTRWHVSPKTGEASKCRAQQSCPFGDLEADHFGTAAEARGAYEGRLEAWNLIGSESQRARELGVAGIPKRGKGKESFSDSRLSFNRAAIDKAFATDANLQAAWRDAVVIFDGCCYLCGERVYDNWGRAVSRLDYRGRQDEVQADHIVPPIRGGTISAGNMAPAHRTCNDAKKDTPVEVYLRALPNLLAKVHEFQERWHYSPPPIHKVRAAQDAIQAIWDEALEKVEALQASLALDMDRQVRDLTDE